MYRFSFLSKGLSGGGRFGKVRNRVSVGGICIEREGKERESKNSFLLENLENFYVREFRESGIFEDIVDFVRKFIKILFRKDIYPEF